MFKIPGLVVYDLHRYYSMENTKREPQIYISIPLIKPHHVMLINIPKSKYNSLNTKLTWAPKKYTHMYIIIQMYLTLVCLNQFILL